MSKKLSKSYLKSRKRLLKSRQTFVEEGIQERKDKKSIIRNKRETPLYNLKHPFIFPRLCDTCLTIT